MVSIYKFRWWVDQVCVPRNRIFFEYAKTANGELVELNYMNFAPLTYLDWNS